VFFIVPSEAFHTCTGSLLLVTGAVSKEFLNMVWVAVVASKANSSVASGTALTIAGMELTMAFVTGKLTPQRPER
jgi:uncharacterized membrane protein